MDTLPPVGNILRQSLAEVLASEAYRQQAEAMVRRECPGCTCGVESSLAMKHGIAGGLFQLSQLVKSGGRGQSRQGSSSQIKAASGHNDSDTPAPVAAAGGSGRAG